ncbi:MAG: Calx-beta domain-containing protein [Micropepsaceae bacterium]
MTFTVIVVPPSISINDVVLAEGNSGTSVQTFTVSLDGPAPPGGVTFDIATADGSAVTTGAATAGGSDYVAKSLTGQTIPAGNSSYTFTVTQNGDTTTEGNDTFLVNISNVTNATIADGQGVGTISNDDAAPSLTINDVSLLEGNSGTTNAVFTVTASNTTILNMGVTVSAASGTATAGTDFTALFGVVTIPPGQTTTTAYFVPVNGDIDVEDDETFFVNLTNPINATIADNQGVGTILNDDSVPNISISNATVNEGNSGTTSANFTVSLNAASSQPVSVYYATASGTASDTSDFGPLADTLTFTPGQTTKTITVFVNGDTTYENNETYTVNLSSPSGGVIADNQGLGTISNDDAAPSLAINDVSVSEAAGTATFTVTRTGPTEVAATVNYATANNTATAPSDYIATSGTLTFAPSLAASATQTFSVAIVNDTAFEGNESFYVNLSAPTAATIADGQGVGTITNDDVAVSIAPTTLPGATAAVAYSQQLTASGGDNGPYTYTITAGALPGGIALSTSGLISGTPTAVGAFNFTVTATDGDGNSGLQAYSLAISPPVITVNPGSIPGGQSGVAYNQAFTATGGNTPYSFAVTAGALPAGLSLSSGGVLSGTPTVDGTFNFTVTASDTTTGAAAPYGGSRVYSLTVIQAAPTFAGIAPASGPTAGGQSVTITGTNFQNASAVTFGGTTAAFTVTSPTSITATTPAHAQGPVNVVVTTPGGAATGTNAYTYIAPGFVRFAINGGDDGSFVFSSATPGLNFTVTTSGGSGSSANISLPPGNYSVSFTTPDGTGLASASCSPATSSVNADAKTAALVIASNVTTVCTLEAVASRRLTVEALGVALDASSRLIIANAPSLSRRIDRLNGGGASDGSASAFGKTFASGLPFSADIGADQVRFAMSLSGLRKQGDADHRFNAVNDNGVPASLAASAAPASGLAATAAGDAAAAMTARSGPRFDVWVEGLLATFDAAANSEGSFAIVHAGADYLVSDNVLVGIGLQGDWLDMDTATGNLDSSGWLAGPYFTARLADGLYLDARAAWGGANFDVSPFGTYTDKVSSDRALYSAALIGSFEMGNLTIRPEGRVTWYKETTEAYIDSLSVAIPEVEIKTGEVSLGPDFEWTLKQQNGGVFMPKIGFDLVWTFQQDNTATQFTGAPGLDETGMRGRVEGGLAYIDPRGVEFGGSLFYDGIGGGDYSAWGGSLKLRFGF